MNDVANDAYIGVGSNIDAYENCREGIKRVLEHRGVRFLALSSLYSTSPVSPIPQDDFLNCALKVGWTGSPLELLALLLSVERKRGRRRDISLGPRTLDLDVLLFDGLVLDTPELIIPHPRLHERRFVLVPLLEIDPHLVHPRLGLPLTRLLSEIGDDQRVDVFGSLRREQILP